jgi:hypothetical protein
VEELFEDLFFAFEELDIVQEEDVDSAVAGLEVIGSFPTNRLDEVVEEVLRGHIPNDQVGIHLECLMANRIEEMGLPQPGAAIDEQRVVVGSGLLGHRHRRCRSESVGLADYEALEAISVDEVGGSGRYSNGPVRGGCGCIALVEWKWLLGRNSFTDAIYRLRAIAEHRPVDTIDEIAVFVLDPAEMELGGSNEDYAVPIDISLQTGQPCVPIRLRDSCAQGVTEIPP